MEKNSSPNPFIVLDSLFFNLFKKLIFIGVSLIYNIVIFLVL